MIIHPNKISTSIITDAMFFAVKRAVCISERERGGRSQAVSITYVSIEIIYWKLQKGLRVRKKQFTFTSYCKCRSPVLLCTR